MNWQVPLDLYCERLDAGLWAEPLNALSNFAFFLAAWLLWRRSASAADRTLAVLVALVGAGSLVFHTHAVQWAKWLDLLFIAVFIYAWLALYARRIFALGMWAVAAVLLAYALSEWALTRAFMPGSFNGSYVYFPALLALTLCGLLALRRVPPAGRMLLAAAGLFMLSVALRSADLALCQSWPTGTHFIWHMLNAAVLYFCACGLHRRRV